MNRLGTSALVVFATAALTLAACDDGPTVPNLPQIDVPANGDVAGGSDGSTTEDTTKETAGPDVGPDEGGDTGGEPPAGCDHAGFTSATKTFTEPQSEVFVYTANSAAAPPLDMFRIELYGGSFGGATAPGTYALEGTNYEDCGNCILVRMGCDGTTCAKTFYADTGSLIITEWAVGGSFKGSLVGVTAKEVTIDTDTYVSTPVVDGETWCLDGQTFEAPIPDGPPLFEGTVDTCVPAGNGNLVGANVADVSYTNCLGDAVNLHAGGCTDNGVKALWVMATAGWCVACEATLAQLVADHGGSLSRAGIGAKTPGLDMLVVLGENQNQGPPTVEYCLAYATKNKLDPAMVVIDNNTKGIQLPLIAPAGYAVTINGLAKTWTSINPYLTSNEGQVQTAYPWHGVLRASNMEYVWSDYFSNLGLNAALTEVLSGP